MDFGKSSVEKTELCHIASNVQADSLFTFMTQLEYLKSCLKNKMVSARYCDENIEYLRLNKIKIIAFPMKCFCDIYLHKIGPHLDCYGYYGLAFSKEWGMEQKIQPIRYINPKSKLAEDYAAAFNSALEIERDKQTEHEKNMKDYLLHEMFYLKPYSGRFVFRNTGEEKNKCFSEECEWRFVPDVTSVEYPQMFYNEKASNEANKETLKTLSDSMSGIPECSLGFEYEDIKYIIIKHKEDYDILLDFISDLDIDEKSKLKLASKILVWEDSKEDF